MYVTLFYVVAWIIGTAAGITIGILLCDKIFK